MERILQFTAWLAARVAAVVLTAIAAIIVMAAIVLAFFFILAVDVALCLADGFVWLSGWISFGWGRFWAIANQVSERLSGTASPKG